MGKQLVRICPSDRFCRVQNLPTSSVELIWPIPELYFRQILATDFMNRFYLDVKTGPNMVIMCYSKSMDQPGKVANPARGPLNQRKRIFPMFPARAPENLVSRDGFGRQSRPVSACSFFHTQAESLHNLYAGSPPLFTQPFVCPTRSTSSQGDRQTARDHPRHV